MDNKYSVSPIQSSVSAIQRALAIRSLFSKLNISRHRRKASHMPRKLCLFCFYLKQGETHIINRRAIVSGVCMGRRAASSITSPSARLRSSRRIIQILSTRVIVLKIMTAQGNRTNVKMVARVQELVDTDPSQSKRSMACELDVSVTLVRKIV